MLNLDGLNEFDLTGIDVSSGVIEKKIAVNIENYDFYDYLRSKINVDRIGEVVFAVMDNDKIWLVRQDEYPKDVYRIPSGGIEFNEPVIAALKREAKEELAIEVNGFKLIGLIEYILKYKDAELKFHSFIFIIDNFNKLEDVVTDGEISNILPVNVKKLKDIISPMLNQEGFWKDWGKLRFYSSYVVYEYLFS